jgi:hypothetical protein
VISKVDVDSDVDEGERSAKSDASCFRVYASFPCHRLRASVLVLSSTSQPSSIFICWTSVLITMASQPSKPTNMPDPILLTLFANRFMSVAEAMGRALQQTAISTNIKERLDFSCALFAPDGDLVANAPFIPIHLGSMSLYVVLVTSARVER